ncbi:hypothetical protein DHD05_05435 [Arenibacter sp. N53]|uniref:hypothetical protein n=1 Tax=Arenibacter TaxID=178469 RepID=UPI000CD3EDED|nr:MULTISPECIES: hypothetical protein [Arenibacter]MCM4151029.1 hypothetical protein [Arenibacter sp. N53]
MQNLKIILAFLFALYVTTSQACRYTIREIGFSTLSKVTYVIYKVDENSRLFPKQQAQGFAESNVKPMGLSLKEDASNPVTNFVEENNLPLPAYILVDPEGRMLVLSTPYLEGLERKSVLFSPTQNQLLAELPHIYASVILIEGHNDADNSAARNHILKACERINNIIPNMPKLVKIGPNMKVISQNNFEEEKSLLWSLGIEQAPKEPIAFIVYGRGRIMGEKIGLKDIKNDHIYKLLSIIGADCECGLDRKWMLGYQIPLNWPQNIRQGLSDDLGFDVDNPMILAEMSRILAIENKVPKDPNNVSFEPLVLDLDEEFNEIPEIMHQPIKVEKDGELKIEQTVTYAIIFLAIALLLGLFIILKRKNK